MNVRISARRAVLLRTVRRVWEDLLNLLSLLVFFTVTAFLFRSWQFALVVTASLGFHELGHAAVLAWLRMPWRIYFSVVGAWTWSPLEARLRLPQLTNVLVHLAGPAASLLLALIALGLHRIWQPPGQHLLILASFSAQVGLLNLLPLGPLTDGGKIIRRVIESLEQLRQSRAENRPGAISLPHAEDKPQTVYLPNAVLLPLGISAVMLVVYALVEIPRLNGVSAAPLMLGLLLVGLWMAASLLIESFLRPLQPPAAPSPEQLVQPQPMTPPQVYLVLMLVWDLLVLGGILSAATPFWLAPEYLLGSLRNVMALLNLLMGGVI